MECGVNRTGINKRLETRDGREGDRRSRRKRAQKRYRKDRILSREITNGVSRT